MGTRQCFNFGGPVGPLPHVERSFWVSFFRTRAILTVRTSSEGGQARSFTPLWGKSRSQMRIFGRVCSASSAKSHHGRPGVPEAD